MSKFPTSCQTIYKERLYIKTYIVNNLFTIMTQYVNSNTVLYIKIKKTKTSRKAYNYARRHIESVSVEKNYCTSNSEQAFGYKESKRYKITLR